MTKTIHPTMRRLANGIGMSCNSEWRCNLSAAAPPYIHFPSYRSSANDTDAFSYANYSPIPSIVYINLTLPSILLPISEKLEYDFDTSDKSLSLSINSLKSSL